MAILQVPHRCPHCREHKDFVIHQLSEVLIHEIEHDPKLPLWERDRHGHVDRPPRRARMGAQVCALSRCPLCTFPVLFVCEVAASAATYAMNLRTAHEGIRVIPEFRVIATYPEIKPIAAHPTWPSEIAAIFNETRQFLAEGRSNFFILAGCRSTLDVVTQKLGATKGNLKERINKLAADGKITAVLQSWAHKLRLDGNEAMHEGDNGRVLSEDPTQFVAFLELLLHMSFELEREIEDRQAKET